MRNSETSPVKQREDSFCHDLELGPISKENRRVRGETSGWSLSRLASFDISRNDSIQRARTLRDKKRGWWSLRCRIVLQHHPQNDRLDWFQSQGEVSVCKPIKIVCRHYRQNVYTHLWNWIRAPANHTRCHFSLSFNSGKYFPRDVPRRWNPARQNREETLHAKTLKKLYTKLWSPINLQLRPIDPFQVPKRIDVIFFQYQHSSAHPLGLASVHCDRISRDAKYKMFRSRLKFKTLYLLNSPLAKNSLSILCVTFAVYAVSINEIKLSLLRRILLGDLFILWIAHQSCYRSSSRNKLIGFVVRALKGHEDPRWTNHRHIAMCWCDNEKACVNFIFDFYKKRCDISQIIRGSQSYLRLWENASSCERLAYEISWTPTVSNASTVVSTLY